jgi:hypothetical protein
MLLIGSQAIKHHFPDFRREPKDLDYAVLSETKTDRNGDKNIEYLHNPVIGHLTGVASIDVLYTLKISHVVGWNINWEKHMFDIQFLRNKGAKIDLDLFYKLYEHWKVVHGKNKRSDLQMSAEDFFNNALDSEHSHDWLHTIINPVPTYTKVLKDGAEVEVCSTKFENLSFDEKCALVEEEVMVMAAERYKGMGYQHRYSKMLKKFIISHAPIWESIFIVENYVRLCKPSFNYMKLINEDLSKRGLNILE